MSTASLIPHSVSNHDQDEDLTVPSDPYAADLYTRNIDSEARKFQTRAVNRYVNTSKDGALFSNTQTQDAHVGHMTTNTTNQIKEFDTNPLPDDLAKRITRTPKRVATFFPIQEWDGYVLEVNSRSFRARLVDITNSESKGEEEAEIPLSELDEDSQNLLQEGRLFRWSIGYQKSPSGQKIRVSRIIVRRLPAWQSEDLKAAYSEAAEISQALKWE